jgi:hypothetical protein
MVGGVLSMRKNAKFSSQGEEYGMELGLNKQFAFSFSS